MVCCSDYRRRVARQRVRNMDPDNNNERDKPTDEKWSDELVLHFDRASMRLNISGRVYSLDTALAMLAQATREYQRQLRTQEAIQLRNEVAQAAIDARLAASLRKQ